MTTGPTTMRIRTWPYLAFAALVNLVLGALALFWPKPTLTVVAFVFGIQLIIIGVFNVFRALVVESDRSWIGVITGVLAVIAGVLVIREPVQPTGWPRAMAPPLGLTFSQSKPSFSSSIPQASAWAAKASFNSMRSMSVSSRPAFSSARGMALVGPMPMISGGTPA